MSEYFVLFPLKFVLKCVPIFGLIYVTLEIGKVERLGDAKYLVGALTFGAIGDFFLLFSTSVPLFLTGMFSFLISHLFYITLLRKKSTTVARSHTEQRNITVGVAAIWILTVLNAIVIWDKLPSKIGVTAYGIVLTSMITFSIVRYKRVPAESYWPILVGALLFGISDNIIGVTKFNDIVHSGVDVVIMVTYYASQYLLCYGNLVGMKSMRKQN